MVSTYTSRKREQLSVFGSPPDLASQFNTHVAIGVLRRIPLVMAASGIAVTVAFVFAAVSRPACTPASASVLQQVAFFAGVLGVQVALVAAVRVLARSRRGRRTTPTMADHRLVTSCRIRVLIRVDRSRCLDGRARRVRRDIPSGDRQQRSHDGRGNGGVVADHRPLPAGGRRSNSVRFNARCRRPGPRMVERAAAGMVRNRGDPRGRHRDAACRDLGVGRDRVGRYRLPPSSSGSSSWVRRWNCGRAHARTARFRGRFASMAAPRKRRSVQSAGNFGRIGSDERHSPSKSCSAAATAAGGRHEADLADALDRRTATCGCGDLDQDAPRSAARPWARRMPSERSVMLVGKPVAGSDGKSSVSA